MPRLGATEAGRQACVATGPHQTSHSTKARAMKITQTQGGGSDFPPDAPPRPPHPLREEGTATPVAPMSVECAQEVLGQLRATSHQHPPAETIEADERRALKLAARLLVERPGTATRLLIMGLEESAHAAHTQAGRSGGLTDE